MHGMSIPDGRITYRTSEHVGSDAEFNLTNQHPSEFKKRSTDESITVISLRVKIVREAIEVKRAERYGDTASGCLEQKTQVHGHSLRLHRLKTW